MKRIHIVIAAATAVLLSSCGTKKAVIADGGDTGTRQQQVREDAASQLARRKLAFVQKVSDNALYQQNIVSKLSFNLQHGSKDITVPGSLHMRKDDVIRIQLFVPIIGTEVGRLEFTKDYVLIVDRIHKQYIKGDYNKVKFLKERGISFYSLQALFWNQLFLPGSDRLSQSQLGHFDADVDQQGNSLPITIRQGSMTFQWSADKTSALINAASVSYVSKDTGTSTLNWTYDKFRQLGSKQFPHKQVLNFKTTAVKQQEDITVTLDMNGATTDSDWEPRTSVSSKYEEVTVEEVLRKIMNF